MSRRPAPTHQRALIGLAGWLFADLMLVIAIVAMGSQADPLAAVKPKAPSSSTTPTTSTPTPTSSSSGPTTSPTPPPTISPTPSPTPPPPTTSPPSKPPGPPTLERTPQIIEVRAAAGNDAALTSQLIKALAPYRGRRAGFVESFGQGPDAGADTAYSQEVNNLLIRIDPALFPVGTPEESYIDLGSAPGGAKIKIYLFTTAS